MPIQIAQRLPGFHQPLELLMQCHRRVENFSAALVRAAEFMGAPLETTEQQRLDQALYYFRTGLPHHAADEEEALFPLLYAVADEAPGMVATLDELTAEHLLANNDHQELDALGRAWLANGTLNATEAKRFRGLASRLQGLYRRHIHLEDSEVYPFARRVLTARQLDVLGAGMAARRGQPFVRVAVNAA